LDNPDNRVLLAFFFIFSEMWVAELFARKLRRDQNRGREFRSDGKPHATTRFEVLGKALENVRNSVHTRAVQDQFLTCSDMRRRQMNIRISCLLIVALAIVALAPFASADVIDFSTVPTGNNPNPLVLPGATFITVGGFNFITPFSGKNSICPSSSSSSPGNCPNILEVQFSTPSSVSFTFSANNDTTIGDIIGAVQVFGGATLLGTANLTVQDASSFIFEPVDLSSFKGITEILISNTDAGGLVYSDFSFTPSTSAVPEPASWLLLVICLVGTAFSRQLRATFRS